MAERKGVWLLDPRFDFLLPGFQKHFQINDKNLTLVGSYHGSTRKGRKTVTVGDTEPGHVAFLEPEDLNRRYAAQLVQDAPDVVAAFTGAYLPNEPRFEAVLATGNVAINANNKRWQDRFFRKHGIPSPSSWSIDGKEMLLTRLGELLPAYEKLVIKLPELSGGYQMAVICSTVEAESFLATLPEELPKQFLVSKYIPHSQSFAGMGLVSRDGSVRWCGATEQVLYHDLAYEGLIWPPFASPETIQEIERLTIRAGNGLAAEGYFGFFNVDYIHGDSGLHAVEINARFGFGTLLYALFCGEAFWSAVQGVPVDLAAPASRIILGKFKGKTGRKYEQLHSRSNILHWFASGKGSFETFFCGIDGPEMYDYGSFIGLFGSFLPMDTSREVVLGEFWKNCLTYFNGKKTLLFMYVEDYLGFQQESFNFAMSPRFQIIINGDKRVLCRATPMTAHEAYWENHPFFCENITGLSLMIGANGSGKTTIYRLLLSWLRDLAKGACPPIPGVLLFRECWGSVKEKHFEDHIISFLKDYTCETKGISIPQSSIRDVQTFLQDVSFTYYTDTMTDIELSGQSFGWDNSKMPTEYNSQYRDYSLNERLCRIPIDTKWNQLPRSALRKLDFTFQAKNLLQKPFDSRKPRDIPVEFLRFSVNTKWETFPLNDLIETLQRESKGKQQKAYEPSVTALSDISATAKGCFLAWQSRLNSLEKKQAAQLAVVGGGLWCYVATALHVAGDENPDLLRTLAAGLFRVQSKLIRVGSDMPNTLFDFEDFFNTVKDFVSNISTAFGNRYVQLRVVAEQIHAMFKNTNWITEVSWVTQVIMSLAEAQVWTTSVIEIRSHLSQSAKEELVAFIDFYEKLTLITDYYRMDWHFPSSGEDNSCNLLAVLTVLEQSNPNRWIFLDEPDNAFHPEWKQILIQQIVSYCRSQENACFQLWLTSHSPIMLSDVPLQAAILLQRTTKGNQPRKKTVPISKSSFAQQIYTLFDDAFFMKQGVVGLFASNQIVNICEKMNEIEKSRAKYKDVLQGLLDEIEPCIEEVQEPVLKVYLSRRFDLCAKKVADLMERPSKRKEVYK